MEIMSIECQPKVLDSLDLTHLSQKRLGLADLTEEEPSEGLGTYSCNYPNCNKTFRYRSEITRHLVTHSERRPYLCTYNGCKKGFKRLDALATHVRLHTGDKPFRCPVGSCQLTFATKAGLRYHTLKHKNNKLYKCHYPGCDQSFLTMSQLKQHSKGTKVHDALTPPNKQEPSQACDEGKIFHDLSTDCENPSWLLCKEYEPPVQKRVHFDPPLEPQELTSADSKQTQQLPVFGTSIKTENTAKLDLSTVLGTIKPTAREVRMTGNFTSIPQPDLTRNMSFSTKKIKKEVKEELDLSAGTQLDQTKLLKSINKVLDENMMLKQHLEFCQKIIRIYQANLGDLKDIQVE